MDQEHDAAHLRLVFNRAAETFPHEIVMPKESRAKLMEWWGKMYFAIVSTEAGLATQNELLLRRKGLWKDEDATTADTGTDLTS